MTKGTTYPSDLQQLDRNMLYNIAKILVYLNNIPSTISYHFVNFASVLLNTKNLGRILALDYGRKRVGIAVTDPLQMIANSLTTIRAHDIWDFLKEYLEKEEVDRIIIGYPLQMNNKPSEAVLYINPFLKRFTKLYPDMPIEQVDERFTSKMAKQAILDAGKKKKERQNKALVDTVSATIILQAYLDKKSY